VSRLGIVCKLNADGPRHYGQSREVVLRARRARAQLLIWIVRYKPMFRGLSRFAAGAGAFIAALVFTVLGFNVPASGQG
jgi:hypothetical protein